MKKGFTLIELLAVIVILAIIALIATPIVLNIINESKESANLRSAEMYLDAVEQAISIEKMNNSSFNPYRCEIKGNELHCDEEHVIINIKGKVPDKGVVYFANGQIEAISLKYDNKVISTNKEGNLNYGNMEKICFPVTEKNKTTGNVPNGEYNKGDEYICEVALGDFHRFFVLGEEENKISLIMDRNIASDGTEVTKDNKELVAWQISRNNADGPVTVMDYLYNATKDWINVPNIQINYTDEGNIGSYGYGTISTNNNITKITKKNETEVTVLTDKEGYENLKARLPKKSEVSNFDGTNSWMYNYLNTSEGISINPISDIDGYWTFSSVETYSIRAWCVYYTGYVVNSNIDVPRAVRPVIELSENNIVGG